MPEEPSFWLSDGAIDPRDLSQAGPFLPPPEHEQHPQELLWLLSKVGRPASYLEIGSREGGSLKAVAPFLEPGAKIRAIDIGQRHPEWQNGRDPVPHLSLAVAELRGKGYDADFLIGNSQSDASLAWAQLHGPYDLVFIDGDHRYNAVIRDWMRYGKLGRLVAFHDIALPAVGLAWRDIKQEGVAVEEMIAEGGTGIGLVRR